MKEGLSLEEMAAEITRQSKLKEDYLVDTRSLQMEPYDSQVYLHMFDGKTEPVEPRDQEGYETDYPTNRTADDVQADLYSGDVGL